MYVQRIRVQHAMGGLDKIDPDGDGNINIPPSLIDGLAGALAKKADQVDLERRLPSERPTQICKSRSTSFLLVAVVASVAGTT